MKLRFRSIFYGWWIVVAGVFMNIISAGIYTYGFSALLLPLIAEFGWGRAPLSGVMSLARLEGGTVAPIAGYLIDRFGPRKLMLVGVAIMGTGFMLLSRVEDLLTFYLVFILVISVGSSFGLGMPVQAAVANWFIRKRSLAMGILMSGLGLGGILIPGFVWIIDNFGWRVAVIMSGIFVWAIGFPMSLVVKHRPEDSGLLPDGEPYQGAWVDEALPGDGGIRSSAYEIGGTSQEEVDFTATEALKTRAFWLLALGFGLSMLTVGVITIHLIPFLVNDMGLSAQLAGGVMGTYAVISVISRVMVGWMGDLVNKRMLLAACLALQAVLLLLLSLVRSFWQLVPLLSAMSIFYGGAIPLRPALQAEYFGRRSFGTIVGILRFLDIWGMAGGPIMAGWIFDVTKSYRIAFLILTATSVVASSVILLATRPVPRVTLTTL